MNTVTQRLWLLLALLICGFGVIFVLPTTPKPPRPGVVMTLPDFIGEWYGTDAVVSERERNVLGAETRFARKQYTNSSGDSIHVSIVLAGEDMSTSIHRPERCLPSQGYTIMNKRRGKALLGDHALSFMRLHNIRPLFDASGRPYLRPDGRQINEYSLIYYWFVGSTETTADHTDRYLIDARDRLLKGCNQPWAYVTVMSRITSNLDKRGRDEAQTDAMLADFVQKLAPIIQVPTVEIR